MSPPLAGYGAGLYGEAGYGAGSPAPLQLLAAIATSANVIQLQFNFPVYLSGLFDVQDASDIAHYTVTAVAGTIGLDGNAARAVGPASAAWTTPAPNGFLLGQCIDLTLDRAMTPYPAQYIVMANGLVSTDTVSALASVATATCYGLYGQIMQPSINAPAPARDFGNPQSASGANSFPNPNNVTLGIFNAGDDGDYAIDSGETSYKKRIYRRMSTRKNGFIFLPRGYGVGLPYRVKQLSSPVIQQEIAADLQSQILQEPETGSAKVNLSSPLPGLARVTLIVHKKTGGVAQKLSATFQGS